MFGIWRKSTNDWLRELSPRVNLIGGPAVLAFPTGEAAALACSWVGGDCEVRPLADPPRPAAPDTANHFGVGRVLGGDRPIKVLLARKVMQPLTAAEALNLAAYLAALADPIGEEFARLLEAVRNA